MKYVECFRALARRRTNEIVITSAGNSGQAWWSATRFGRKLLSRCVDESVDHVRLRPGFGAARTQNMGLHG